MHRTFMSNVTQASRGSCVKVHRSVLAGIVVNLVTCLSHAGKGRPNPKVRRVVHIRVEGSA